MRTACLLLILFGLSFIAGPATAHSQSSASICTIVRIIDGDTVDCRENAENLRLLLIDTPEMDQGDFGRAARDGLAAILPIGTRARMETDVQLHDRYRRILAYLHTEDGRMVNREMVRLGYAVVAVYPPNVKHLESIRSAADEARMARRGLWSGSAFDCLPADHRASRC